ncbi:hypothetical protein L1987_17944 [Smallanthus sonchifolius]|uniref:Uncharacterized protein n=1 Tax=Smallanthus sonchifolius TaxID=185202 RepID=A0ACB9IYY6_9ASTR|nr:hypothetical protein L1987_17944 [Smallanthus sonchifolius]
MWHVFIGFLGGGLRPAHLLISLLFVIFIRSSSWCVGKCSVDSQRLQMCILLRGLQQCRFTLKKASPWMIGGFPKLEIGLGVIG